jgi:hypothetical protein
LGHPAEGRHGGSAVAEPDGQKAAGDGQADAFGLGGGGEQGLAVGVAGDSLGALAFECGDACVKAVVLLEKIVEAFFALGPVDGVEDTGGVAIEGLSGGAA